MARSADGHLAGRVIAGSARGRRLIAPSGTTRPLGDRVKETLFAILEPDLRGRPFLDLFAGSGAAGVEALSRGAERAVFVERALEAIEAIERNLASTGLAGPRAVVIQAEAVGWLRGLAVLPAAGTTSSTPFGIAFLDPPYDSPDVLLETLGVVAAAGPGRILSSHGITVSKHFWRTSVPGSIGLLASVRARRFGDTVLTFHRWVAAPGDATPAGATPAMGERMEDA